MTAVLLVIFLGGLSWKAWSWSRERDQSEAARRTGEAVSRLLQGVLQDSAGPDPQRDWPELLAHAESVARSSLKEQPASLASALAVVGRHHAERGAFADARRLLAEALPALSEPTEALEAGCDEAWAQARQGDNPQ